MAERIELRPTAASRRIFGFLGLLFGLGLFAVGAVAPHRSLPPMIAGVAIGIATIWLVRKISQRRLIVDDDGVETRGMFGDKRIAWSEIESYTFVSIDPHSRQYGQGGLAGAVVVAAVKAMEKKPQHRAFRAGHLMLHGGGRKVTVAPWFKDIDQALERIFGELSTRLGQRAGTQFGPFAFDGQTLRHDKKGELTIMELDKVEVTATGAVVVRKVGKRLPWASASMAKLPCSLVLLERLADRGVHVEVSKSVFLPMPTLGLMSRIATARSNLPQARVQR